MNIIESARKLAYKWHDGQLYGTHPYTDHLAAVVESLRAKHGRSATALLATAWLHDSLEDTMIVPQDIADQCGIEVYDAVAALTKYPGYTYDFYISQVKRHPIALEVKQHDTLCNLSASVMSGERGRIRKYAKQLLMLTEEL